MGNRHPTLMLAGGLLLAVAAFGSSRPRSAAGVVPVSVSGPQEALSRNDDWTACRVLPTRGKARRPWMRCRSAIVVDNVSGEILYSRAADRVRPIASLTKLLTAMVFLESGVDLSTIATVTRKDARNSSKSYFRRGEKLTLRDFLYAALVSSDNRAARVLARSAGMSTADFVARMNDKAHDLGMDSTCIVEPTGLSENNVSTAHDCAILLNVALKNHLIRRITTTGQTTVRPLNRKRNHRLVNTNRLLRYGYRFLGSKTGYISAAGWCVAARGFSLDGHDVTVVVLGAPSNRQRFRALDNALRWAYSLPRDSSPDS